MNAVGRWAYSAIVMSIVYTVMMFSAMVMTWIGGARVAFYNESVDMLERIPDMPVIHRMLGLIVDGLGFCIIFVCVFFFICLMRLFSKGSFFSADAISYLSKLSRWALAWAIYNPLRYTLLSVITSWHFPAGIGKRELSIAFGSTDFINILVVGCLVMITTFIKDGYALQQERDLTI